MRKQVLKSNITISNDSCKIPKIKIWQKVHSTHVERELARVVVHAARVHQREHVAGALRVELLLASQRTHPAVGQRGGKHRTRVGCDFDRAQLQDIRKNQRRISISSYFLVFHNKC